MRLIDRQTMWLPPEASFITGARAFEGGVALPWTYENVLVATEAGIPCISPMARDYTFPIRAPFHARDYQVQDADFLARHKRAYLLNDPGTGKTLVAAWAMDYLFQTGVIRNALVVAPGSILETAWGNDLSSHLPHLRYHVLSGTAARRKELASRPVQVHIINWEGVHWLLPTLVANDYDLVIYDESTAIGNASAQRALAIRKVVKPHARLWQMTGTPIPESPQTAYGQIVLMDNVDEFARFRAPGSGPVFMSPKRWKHATMHPIKLGDGTTKWVKDDGANEVVFRYMQPARRRSKRDVLAELPPVVNQHFDVELGLEQRRAVKDMEKHNLHGVSEATVINAVNAGVAVSKIIQIACGVAYAEPVLPGVEERGRLEHEFPTPGKDAQLTALLDGSGTGHALVYVPYRAPLKRLAAWLRRTRGARVSEIYGTMGASEIADVIRDFQTDPNPHIIVAIPQKMSHGITATAADLIVWYGPVIRAEVYQQANQRTDRIGQRNSTLIAHLAATATERKLYRKLETSTLDQNALLDMYASIMKGDV